MMGMEGGKPQCEGCFAQGRAGGAASSNCPGHPGWPWTLFLSVHHQYPNISDRNIHSHFLFRTGSFLAGLAAKPKDRCELAGRPGASQQCAVGGAEGRLLGAPRWG